MTFLTFDVLENLEQRATAQVHHLPRGRARSGYLIPPAH
jgi:hypothetical protein